MFCPKCNAENKTNLPFCTVCGAEIANIPAAAQTALPDLAQKDAEQQPSAHREGASTL